MAIILASIYILVFLIFGLVAFAIAQIRLFGIRVKDFWSFIEANQTLDKLYKFAKQYERMTPQEQVIYLSEAEKVFRAFDKIPVVLGTDLKPECIRMPSAGNAVLQILGTRDSHSVSVF